ncbi:MAG TPA: PucR family transcriptional regulator ligand-binding domain-containing protein [Nocardioides sp.]|nr:PucR family transcriptional regulator ligand-binding domain-containing protein [Nocardioides sp.]
MTFTVGDLLATEVLGTRSLTPGVGERRPVEWAHTCELAEPWHWVGAGALVLTTGLGVPTDADEQCAYVEGLYAAGIAAVSIGAGLSAPPLHDRMLARATELGLPVLETAHAVPFIKVAKAVAEANNREHLEQVRLAERRLHGSLLLRDLLDASIGAESAERFLEPHRVAAPYLLAGWRGEASAEAFDRIHASLRRDAIAHLLTATDGFVLVLAGATDTIDPAINPAIDPAVDPAGPIAISRTFGRIEDVPEAFRQVRLVLSRTPPAHQGTVRFEDSPPTTLFLPDDPARLRDAVDRTLGGLFAYDAARGTDLVTTLRVFLEENRSWVRASRRLFVHRQTLVARVARIEEVTGHSLSTTDGASELWQGIRAAVEVGDLPA